MQVQLDPLLTAILTRGRTRMLRREIARRQRAGTRADNEKECIDMLFEWLCVSCQLSPFSEDDPETVGEFMQSELFALTVVYLEGLVTVWTERPPGQDREDCLRTIVDLLSNLTSKKQQTRFESRYQPIASLCLCAALWNNERGQPLLLGVKTLDIAKSDLFALVRDEKSLAGFVRVVRGDRSIASALQR